MSNPATTPLFTDSNGNTIDFLQLVSGDTSNPLNDQYNMSEQQMYLGLAFDGTSGSSKNADLFPLSVNSDGSTALSQVFFNFLGSSNFTGVTSWKSFIDAWRTYLSTNTAAQSQFNAGVTPNPPSTSTDDTSTTGGAYSGVVPFYGNAGFFAAFENALGSTVTDLNANGVNINMTTLFNQAFSQFIQTYQLPSNATDATALNDFLTSWSQYCTVVASITQASANTATLSDLLSYQQIFTAFFPKASSSDFSSTLKNFFTNIQQNTSSPLLPSQYLSQWYQQLQQSYLQSQTTSPTLPAGNSQVIATDSYKAQILVEIFFLLVGMINSIQQITAVQTQRLTYLSQFQQAYTVLMSEVPTFTEGDGKPEPLSGPGISDPANTNTDNTNPLNARNSLNTEMTADLDNLRSYQSILSDDAKQVQSLLSQDNEADNEQATLATNFIQTFSSIMQTLFQ